MSAPQPGAHGGDGALLARNLGVDPSAVLDLSASLNPLAEPVAPIVAAHLDAAGRYPDARPATLALADALGVDPDRVVLTNGGAEAIALVAAECPRGWVEEPEFSLYRRHLEVLAPDAPRWRSNPRNPTGRLADPDEVAGVWDEAFYPLATGRWTRGDAERGSVVVGSLTKLFAAPGLRLGYVLAPDPALAAAVRRRQPRWSVNGLAAAVVPELLAGADLAGWAEEIARLRARLVALLADHGHRAEPSAACYVLVRRAPGLRDRLAARGVLVRDTGSFGLVEGVRVAVPDHRGLERLADALADADADASPTEERDR